MCGALPRKGLFEKSPLTPKTLNEEIFEILEKRKMKKIFKNSVIIFLILFYWVWLLLVTPPATDHNTVELQKTITDVQIFRAKESEGRL